MQPKQNKSLFFPLGAPRYMLASMALSAAILFLPGTIVALNSSSHTGSTNSEAKSSADTQWGVKVIGVRSTAAGYMLEFRYRVVDAEKSASLFERKTKPYLTHIESGKVLGVPTTAKLGPLRNSNTPKEGRNYWMFFGNAGRLVKSGDKVSIAIGDFQSGELTVE